jgi:hypothetical protein
MNKYKAESRAAQEKRRKFMACEAKKTYQTRELAEKGIPRPQRAYRCRYCGLWHRTGGTLAAILGRCR